MNVVIDYTLSNKNPEVPDSLHYMYQKRNDYSRIIEGVLEIINNYTED